jgi:hypothetical protein
MHNAGEAQLGSYSVYTSRRLYDDVLGRFLIYTPLLVRDDGFSCSRFVFINFGLLTLHFTS